MHQTRAVLLLHTRPGEPSHYDLLLERPPSSPERAQDPDDRRLITFRLDHPLPEGAPSELSAQRSPDHRALYLDHTGPLTNARGSVQRTLSARLTTLIETPTTLRAVLQTADALIAIDAVCTAADRWRLLITPAHSNQAPPTAPDLVK